MPRNAHGFPTPYLCPLPADEVTTANQRALDIVHGIAAGVVVFGPIILACAIALWGGQ